jgi:HD superfamily phosphodiesterase
MESTQRPYIGTPDTEHRGWGKRIMINDDKGKGHFKLKLTLEERPTIEQRKLMQATINLTATVLREILKPGNGHNHLSG